MKNFKLKKGHALVLRTCKPDMTSYGGFQWPTSGIVECKDWDPSPVCGNGLHGFLWGEGDADLAGIYSDNWLVCDVIANDCVDLNGKVKFKSAYVVFCGNKFGAIEFIKKYLPEDKRCNWMFSYGGNKAVQTGGHGSTQTARHESTQTAGHESTQTAGSLSTQKAGGSSTQTAGSLSTQKAGNYSTQMAGHYSTQKAGHGSTQMAGHYSTQMAGHYSTQKAGHGSTQKAGHGSILIMEYICKDTGDFKTAICTVDINGPVFPGKPYTVNGSGEFVEVKE